MHAQLETAPEVLHFAGTNIIVQFNLNDGEAIAGKRLGFVLFYLLVCKNIVFERLGNLLLHIGDRGSRVHSGYDTLTYGEVGKLVFVHLVKGKYTESNKYSRDENDDLPVVHRPFYNVSLLIHLLF